MKIIVTLLFSSLLTACSHTNMDRPQIKEALIPIFRKDPKAKPVASYLIPMGDPKLERVFGVEVFETPFTFKYLLSMQSDGMLQTDTLYLPNLDTSPMVVIRPGAQKFSCIIGFLDNKKIFREYKMLYSVKDQLKLKVLKSYAVTTN